MRYLNALLIAFSTYSRLPMPQAEWSDENRRLTLVFFPVIGAVIGAVLFLWLTLCDRFGFGALLRGTVGAALPLLITGGIHMDGLMDTTDALASWKSPEERLAILKDSHVGAFAVMGCCLYLMVMSGLMSEAAAEDGLLLGVCFVLSRAMSAMAAVWLKNARGSGMLADVARQPDRKSVTAACIVYLALCAVLLIAGDAVRGLCVLLGAAACFVYYRRMAYRHFGGVTGDLAGWYLQWTELITLGCVVLGRCILK